MSVNSAAAPRFFRLLLASVNVVALAYGGQSLVLSRGAMVTTSLPNKAPYTLPIQKNQSFRFQFRIHSWTPVNAPLGDETLWTAGGAFGCSIGADSVLVCADGFDVLDDSSVYISLIGRNDFVVTVERDVAEKTFYAQVCDVTLNNCVTSVKRTLKTIAGADGVSNRIPSVTLGGPKTSAAIAYFRWATGPGPITPPRDSDATADLLALEFDGKALVTAGTVSKAPSVSGKSSYVETPLYPPGCSAGAQKTFRAGFPATLNGTGSVALDGDTRLSYSWAQVSGPSTVVWTNQSSAQPGVQGLQFGSYVFQLTVTDGSGQSTSCTVKHGAVATDNNGVVVYSNPALTQLLGPVIRWGANPWPWFDERHKAVADHFGALQSVAPPTGYIDFWNTADEGKIEVTRGSKVVQGAGTSFQRTFCGGGTQVSPASNQIIIWYPLPGGGKGRRAYTIATCESDTALTLTANYIQASGSGVSYTMTDDTGQGPRPLGLWYNGSDNANYYDNALAFYILYYRSGIDDYLTYARTLADRWWTMPFIDEGRTCSDDNGNWCVAPRMRDFTSLVLRALDGRPDMWPGLRLWVDYDGSNAMRLIFNPLYDVREEAATLNELSLAALYDPDASRRSTWQGWVSSILTRKWAVQQQPDKNWVSPLYGFASWNGFPGTVTVTNGSTTVSGNGTPWDCSRTDIWQPATRLWTTVAAADAVHGDEIAYAVRCVDSQTLSITPAYQGTSASGRGWFLGGIAGTGTQPFMMGYVGSAMSRAYEAMKSNHADAASLARQFTIDAVNWIRNPDYGGYRAQWKGLWYARGFIGCEPDPSQNPACNGGADNNEPASRYLAAETLHAFAAAYTYSHDPGILAAGDELYGALYGRSGGPVVSGDGIDLCGFVCDDSWDLSHNKAKTFGFMFGWGDGSSWPAARVASPNKTASRPVPVSFDLASVPRATHVHMIVTEPSGTSEEYTCTFSPCSTLVDPEQGESLITIEYLTGYGGPVAKAVTSLVAAQ